MKYFLKQRDIPLPNDSCGCRPYKSTPADDLSVHFANNVRISPNSILYFKIIEKEKCDKCRIRGMYYSERRKTQITKKSVI